MSSNTVQQSLDYFNTNTNSDNIQGANSVPMLNMKASGTAQFLVDVFDKNGNPIAGGGISSATSPLSITAGNISLLDSGNTAGRAGTEILIQRATLTNASTFSPTAFSAGAYRSLRFYMRLDSGAATAITITLTGLSGTYKMSAIYQTSADFTVLSGFGSSTAWTSAIGATPSVIQGTTRIDTGGIRSLNASILSPDGQGAGVGLFIDTITGYNTDTTNGVTAFVCTFSGGNATGIAELWGLP